MAGAGQPRLWGQGSCSKAEQGAGCSLPLDNLSLMFLPFRLWLCRISDQCHGEDLDRYIPTVPWLLEWGPGGVLREKEGGAVRGKTSRCFPMSGWDPLPDWGRQQWIRGCDAGKGL